MAVADGGDLQEGLSQEAEQERRLQEGIGVPHIIIDCASDTDQTTPFTRTLLAGKLPSVEQVMSASSSSTSRYH